MAAASSKDDALQPNPRGIPPFPFMNSVSDYVTKLEDVEPTLRRFQEMINKYQFMEVNVTKRAQGLREKLPEMQGTLSTVRFLRGRKRKLAEANGDVNEDPELEEDQAKKGEIQTTFSLSETLYAHAKVDVKSLEEVYLWLGANVMVAYPLEEAEEMLAGKLEKAKESLKACEEDLEFLRIQITTLEVATARVYNWDVVEKRKVKAAVKGNQDEDDEKEDGNG